MSARPHLRPPWPVIRQSGRVHTFLDEQATPIIGLVMAALTIELPQHDMQTAYNLSRWAELLASRELARFEGRIETDRHGHIIMSPPSAPSHGSFQSEITYLLRSLMPRGRVLTECPISTAGGVKAADVAWASPQCMRDLGNHVCFPRAPEICVEVLSPSNTARKYGKRCCFILTRAPPRCGCVV